MKRQLATRGLVWASVLLALLLMLVPLPPMLAAIRPYWLALVVAYWVLEAPERAGLGFAFVCGLLADLTYGALLGEQAMRLVIFAFLLDRFRSRLRFFPTWQQSLAILGLLLNDHVVAALLHAMLGLPQPPLLHWLSPVSGALMWGPCFLLLDTLRQRRRRN